MTISSSPTLSLLGMSAVSPLASANAQTSPPPEEAGALRRGIDWLDQMSSPRPSTMGDFDGPAWFQAGFQSTVEGFYLGGLAASGGCLAATMAGLWVGEKTHNQFLACATGASVGSGVMGALASAGGPAAYVPAAITGGLLGAFVTFRGNRRSRIRDSAGNAAMLAGPFMHGPSKVAAGLGAATAQRIGGSASRQILVGAVVAGGLGAALGAVGYAPLGVLGTGLVCGAAGAIGPFFGPRFSQFWRNSSLSMGDHMVSGAKHLGVVKKAPSRRMTNAVGAIPSSFMKEGVRGAILADLSVSAFFLGGIAESIQQMDIFLHSREGNDEKAPTAQTAPPQPAPAPAARDAAPAA